MTRKSKKYQLPIITLLLCFLQVGLMCMHKNL